MKRRFTFFISALPILIHYNFYAQPVISKLPLADSLYKEGQFEDAKAVYSEVISEDPGNYKALLSSGKIALISNELNDAEDLLMKAMNLTPDESEAKQLLAEIYYRQDEFTKAVPLLHSIGKEIFAHKLESFRNKKPYDISDPEETIILKFVSTDPLPLMQLCVNKSEPLYFLLDTGASEVIINSEMADKLGVVQFGSDTGTFAGGKKADSQHGFIDSLILGQVTIKNVPVRLLHTVKFSAAAGGKKVDGIIGTVLLYHFLSTIDYIKGELILRPKNSDLEKKFKTISSYSSMPFWMSGDHIIVTWGKVNKSNPLLFFVDTGAAGFGFLCPASTIDAANISLSQESLEGIGGGGKVSLVPFYCDELSLGDVNQQKVFSAFGPFPEDLEYNQGFHIGGLISHNFFRPFSLTLDFSNMKIYLSR